MISGGTRESAQESTMANGDCPFVCACRLSASTGSGVAAFGDEPAVAGLQAIERGRRRLAPP